MKNIFKQIISDFHAKPIRTIKERDLQIELDTSKIISIIWPRRSGKSYYLFGIIEKLLSIWVEKTCIVYINFEDERIDIDGGNLQLLIDAYLELYNGEDLKDVYFFFDEIQNIDNWEKFVRRLYDEVSTHIFLTGSNAKLLSKEISTSLRGRSISYELLPLSFKEFLSFKNQKINIHVTKERAKLVSLQREFIQWGWFPEVSEMNEELKVKTLQEYFDVMLYNDIVERYKVKDAVLLKQFVKLLLQTSTKDFSINKIGHDLQSMGFRFDKNILYDFLDHLDTIYFGKSVSKFDHSFKKQTLKKFYLIDNGFLNALSFKFSDNYGKLLENTVFTELYRRHGEGIYFLRNGSETDFLVNDKHKLIYQVCYDLNLENRDREILGCIDAMEKFEVTSSTIITFEQEESMVIDGKHIEVLPFYKVFL